MTTTIPYFIAFLSTTAFLILCFWVVRKELRVKRNMVESAKAQLVASRAQNLRASDGVEAKKAQEILSRSLDIYHQSVELYNDALRKPWNRVIGGIMGFRQIIENEKAE